MGIRRGASESVVAKLKRGGGEIKEGGGSSSTDTILLCPRDDERPIDFFCCTNSGGDGSEPIRQSGHGKKFKRGLRFEIPHSLEEFGEWALDMARGLEDARAGGREGGAPGGGPSLSIFSLVWIFRPHWINFVLLSHALRQRTLVKGPSMLCVLAEWIRTSNSGKPSFRR